MKQINQKGRAIFGVIAAIAVIAFLCFLFVYICRTSHASNKAQKIAEAIAVRSQIYCPQIQKDVPQSQFQKYAQNGPYGTTIVLNTEKETPQLEAGKAYFSITVDSPSKAVCKKLIKTDIFQADLYTIDEKVDGKCPGLIRFYFSCPYDLDQYQNEAPYFTPLDEQIKVPHFTFTPPKNHHSTQDKLKCKEPTPYEDKQGNCVECLIASQCHESQDCVENMCMDCPEHSNRTVRIGQRIGTRNCYCQEGYQLNTDQTACVIENNDWDITQNCVGNHCSVCPENANHNKGQRVGSTDCYCADGYLPRQTGATQWQCAKVVILYPEQDNQIIVHDEKYPVPAPRPVQTSHAKKAEHAPVVRPAQTRPNFHSQPNANPAFGHQPMMMDWEALFEPAFIPEPILLPFSPDGFFNVQAWESLEITIQ